MSSLGTENRGRRRQRSRLSTFLAIAAVALVALPASAQAFSVSGTASPSSLAAGAHSNFDIHLAFSGGTPKDLTIGLPPGEIGDPNATPFCSVAQLNADNCPANTMLGNASSMVSLLGVLPNPLPVSGNVYNVQPQPGEPARFGIALHALPLPAPLNTLVLPPVIIQSGVQLRQSDFGLDTIVRNVPNSATLIQLGGSGIPVSISITSMDLSLFGVAPGTGRPFLRNPTSCTPHHAAFSAVPYSGSGASGQAPAFTPTNCLALDFSPAFSAKIGGKGHTATSTRTSASTSIDQDNGEAGLLRAQVAIPPDLNPDLNLLGNRCSPAQFLASSCPPNSVMGSAIATSPLLTQPLSGPVVLVDTGGIPNFGLDLRGQLHLQLQGSLSLEKVVTFDGLPDIPISHFQLTFTPSPGLLIASRNLCVPPPPNFHADFLGYNGKSASVDAAATVDGCGGALGKCKKGKGKRKHRSLASTSKKHKHRSCKHRKKHKKK
jgi:hypothetical protein